MSFLVTRRYCDPLVVSCYFDFSCSLEVLCFCLCSWSRSHTCSLYYLTSGVVYVLRRCSETISDLFCVHLLHAPASSYGKILKLICSLWILEYPWSSADSLSFVFSNVMLELKFVVSCSIFWLVFYVYSLAVFQSLFSLLPSGAHRKLTKRSEWGFWMRHIEYWSCP